MIPGQLVVINTNEIISFNSGSHWNRLYVAVNSETVTYVDCNKHNHFMVVTTSILHAMNFEDYWSREITKVG